jgi:hypothetical protein
MRRGESAGSLLALIRRRGRRALIDQAAALEHQHVRPQPLDLGHVVRRQQHRGGVLALIALEVAADDVRGVRIERGGRLVEQEELGPVDQRLGQHEARLLAGREPPRRAIEQTLEIEVGAQRGDALTRTLHPVQVGVHEQVLSHAEARGQIDIGRGEVHAPEHAGAVPRHLLAEHGDPAGAGREQPEDHGDRAGLAGAIRAEQRRGRARRHLEAEVVDGDHVAVALGQVLHPNGWAHLSQLTFAGGTPAAGRIGRSDSPAGGRWPAGTALPPRRVTVGLVVPLQRSALIRHGYDVRQAVAGGPSFPCGWSRARAPRATPCARC